MMPEDFEILKHFITVLVPLIIIMDPFGNLPFFLLFTEGKTRLERTKTAATASGVACLILIFFSITGDAVLSFFHIGLPAFQLAGGFIFFVYALQLLHLIPGGIRSTEEEEQEGIAKEHVALVPLATPLLAGPGAITAVLVWQQSYDIPFNLPILTAAITAACIAVFFTFFLAEWILRILGIGGIRVITRIMGLVLAVIAVQFMVDGFMQLQ
jgi:multiple antibiotic resistance protein